MDEWNNPYLQKLRSISIGTSGLDPRITDTHFYDKQIVEEGLRDKDPNVRRQAKHAGERIAKQRYNGKLNNLRKELIGLHRQGKVKEVKDMHEIIKKNE